MSKGHQQALGIHPCPCHEGVTELGVEPQTERMGPTPVTLQVSTLCDYREIFGLFAHELM